MSFQENSIFIYFRNPAREVVITISYTFSISHKNVGSYSHTTYSALAYFDGFILHTECLEGYDSRSVGKEIEEALIKKNYKSFSRALKETTTVVIKGEEKVHVITMETTEEEEETLREKIGKIKQKDIGEEKRKKKIIREIKKIAKIVKDRK